MKLSLEVNVESALWRRLPQARSMARETVEACVAEAGLKVTEGAEVSLLLADDARLQSLNANWRGLDKPTNVLSFPAAPRDQDSGPQLIGDIAIAYETIEREAQSSGAALGDHYRRLVAHGFLHLIGYDHERDEEADQMESLERRVLARLGVRDPYIDEALIG